MEKLPAYLELRDIDLSGLDFKYLEDLQLSSSLLDSVNYSFTANSSSRTLSSTEVSPTTSLHGAALTFVSANEDIRGDEAAAVAEMQIQRNMQLQLLQQQQQQQWAIEATSAERHFAASPNCSEQQDEISRSLKMFAMLTAHSNDNEPQQLHPQSPVDDIMKDFACNGNICEENNHYEQYQEANNFAQNSVANTTTHSTTINFDDQLLNHQQPQFSTYLNDMRSHFWKMLPTHKQQQSQPATVAGVAANINYNTMNSNINKNLCGSFKKPHRRYSNVKIDNKYTSVKHCVFCENNNEPEAVTKSHTVRDALGRVLCPKLRTYVCPICSASGDNAHTVKYCPQKPIITMEDAINAESFRLAKNAYYKQQMKV